MFLVLLTSTLVVVGIAFLLMQRGETFPPLPPPPMTREEAQGFGVGMIMTLAAMAVVFPGLVLLHKFLWGTRGNSGVEGAGGRWGILFGIVVALFVIGLALAALVLVWRERRKCDAT